MEYKNIEFPPYSNELPCDSKRNVLERKDIYFNLKGLRTDSISLIPAHFKEWRNKQTTKKG